MGWLTNHGHISRYIYLVNMADMKPINRREIFTTPNLKGLHLDTWTPGGFASKGTREQKLRWNHPCSRFVNPTCFIIFRCDFAMFRLALAAVLSLGLACQGDECDASSLLHMSRDKDVPKKLPKGCTHGIKCENGSCRWDDVVGSAECKQGNKENTRIVIQL